MKLSEQVCVDLLRSKQEHLDRGLSFEFPGDIVCERCTAFFATLDLAQEACLDLARGELPDAVREALLERLRQEG